MPFLMVFLWSALIALLPVTRAAIVRRASYIEQEKIDSQPRARQYAKYQSCLTRHAPPLDLWRTRYPAQLERLFGTYPLSDAALSRATRPAGHEGNRFRLARALRGRKPEMPPLRIAILGDSMTMGHGCTDEKRLRESSGLPPPLDPNGRPWPTRLAELLEGRGIGRVLVDNLAYPSQSDVFLQTRFKVVEDALASADVILVAYSLDDGMLAPEKTTEVVRMLRGLPQKPAVVYVETLEQDRYMKSLPFTCEWQNVTKFAHWPALVAEQIPTVSYSEGLCPRAMHLQNVGTPGAALFWEGRFWNASSHTDHDPWSEPSVRSSNTIDNPHPYCLPAHELLAQMVAALMLEVSAAEICSDLDENDLAETIGSFCSKDVATSLDPLKVNEHGQLTVKRKHDGLIDFPGLSIGDSWVLREDRPGKPAWIARAGVPGNAGGIIFPVRLGPKGRIIVNYLRSYGDVGNATCQLTGPTEDIREGPELHLEALWDHAYSLGDAAALEVAGYRALKEHCQRRACGLLCKKTHEDKKFVINSITSC